VAGVGSQLTPKRIGRHLFVLTIVAGCVVAGFWQRDRLHQVRVRNARVEHQLAQPLTALGSLVGSGTIPQPDALTYRRVDVTGRFDDRREVVLVGRESDLGPGNHLLTPLLTADGWAVLVDRGWVPYQLDTPPVSEAIPPGSTVDVTGVLLPSEVRPSSASRSEPRVADLTKVDIPRIAGQLPYPLLPVYLLLQRQSPGQRGQLPQPASLAPLSEGPHFSYMIQWFLFASIGIVGYPIVLRRELRRSAP
jgi:cytochrome oxidase assembly protein ShyY1